MQQQGFSQNDGGTIWRKADTNFLYVCSREAVINLVYKVRIRRQENQKSDSYWQEFEFGGSENSSIAAVLNELNSRSPLTDVGYDYSIRLRQRQ